MTVQDKGGLPRGLIYRLAPPYSLYITLSLLRSLGDVPLCVYMRISRKWPYVAAEMHCGHSFSDLQFIMKTIAQDVNNIFFLFCV